MVAKIYRDSLEEFLRIELPDAVQHESTLFDELTAPFPRSLVIFGAGGLGRKVLTGLRRTGVEPLAMADNNSRLWGTAIEGIPVFSPQEAAQRFGESAAFIISIWSEGADRRIPLLRRQLSALGCRTILSFVHLFRKHPDLFLPHCRIDLPAKALAAAGDIRKAFDLLADDASQAEYLTQLRWMLSTDFGELPPGSPHDSYFPAALITADRNEVFVDCGAFDGDTTRSFLMRRGDAFSRIFAIEPDPANFQTLQDYVAGLPETLRAKISAVPYAIGAARETLRFEATGNVSSCLSTQGTCEVECLPLAEITGGAAPTYVKMDIEGAEIAALNGARRLIEARLPVLAACVYHEQDHLWRIPLLMRSISDQYRFFMRRHGEFFDVVCYAVPPSRLVKADPLV